MAIITLRVIVPGRCTHAKQPMNVIKVYFITAIIAAKKNNLPQKRAARTLTAGFAFFNLLAGLFLQRLKALRLVVYPHGITHKGKCFGGAGAGFFPAFCNYFAKVAGILLYGQGTLAYGGHKFYHIFCQLLF